MAALTPGTRRRSAEQHMPAHQAQLAFAVAALAMRYVRLTDTSRLPVERTTLQGLLQRWGAFVHTGSAPCKLCAAPSAHDVDLCTERPEPLRSSVLRIRNAKVDVDQLQCGAKWVLQRGLTQSRASSASRKEGEATASTRPASRSSGRARHFLVWQGSRGSSSGGHQSRAVTLHTHVSVLASLYADLVVLMAALQESLHVVDAHADMLAQYNKDRVQQGRFLFGHVAVDEATGGVFVVDASAAQPHSALNFALHQLGQLLEAWCGPAADSCHIKQDIVPHVSRRVKLLGCALGAAGQALVAVSPVAALHVPLVKSGKFADSVTLRRNEHHAGQHAPSLSA